MAAALVAQAALKPAAMGSAGRNRRLLGKDGDFWLSGLVRRDMLGIDDCPRFTGEADHSRHGPAETLSGRPHYGQAPTRSTKSCGSNLLAIEVAMHRVRWWRVPSEPRRRRHAASPNFDGFSGLLGPPSAAGKARSSRLAMRNLILRPFDALASTAVLEMSLRPGRWRRSRTPGRCRRRLPDADFLLVALGGEKRQAPRATRAIRRSSKRVLLSLSFVSVPLFCFAIGRFENRRAS